MARLLARCVPQLDFAGGRPPAYLFSSRRPGRCNPRGVECVYFAETEATADLEYRQRFKGTAAAHQPKLTFFARVRLARIVDLSHPDVCLALGGTQSDLFGPWRPASNLTRLQCIGLEVSRHAKFAGVRFPSAAAHLAGRAGWNIVAFRAALKPPDYLQILGIADEVLEVWP